MKQGKKWQSFIALKFLRNVLLCQFSFEIKSESDRCHHFHPTYLKWLKPLSTCQEQMMTSPYQTCEDLDVWMESHVLYSVGSQSCFLSHATSPESSGSSPLPPGVTQTPTPLHILCLPPWLSPGHGHRERELWIELFSPCRVIITFAHREFHRVHWNPILRSLGW